MKNKKRNNKGFSLVELIVVIAIMAILAVTLAPRLVHYVEKARQASDQEVANAVYNAARLAYTDDTLASSFKSVAKKITVDGLVATTTVDYYVLELDYFYNPVGTTAEFVEDATYTTGASQNAFCKEIHDIVGNYKLKSKDASNSTDIAICYKVSTDEFTVITNYSGLTITAAGATAGTTTAALLADISNANYEVTK